MMKLYRSLLFRELKISKRHYAVRILLMASFAALLMLAVFMAWKEDIANAPASGASEMIETSIAMFGMMFGLLSAILAGYDTDVLKSDVSCGWKRYSYALPVTAKDKALAHYSVKGAAMLVGGILCGIFAAVIEAPMGQQLVAGTVNTYLVTLDALLLAGLFRELLMAAGLTEKRARLLGMLFNLLLAGAFFLWLYISYFDKFMENVNDMMENGENLSMEAAAGILDTAESLSFIPFTVLILLAVCSFFVSVRAQERREP